MSATVRALAFLMPAGAEGMFAEFDGKPVAELEAFASRYGSRFIGPQIPSEGNQENKGKEPYFFKALIDVQGYENTSFATEYGLPIQRGARGAVLSSSCTDGRAITVISLRRWKHFAGTTMWSQ